MKKLLLLLAPLTLGLMVGCSYDDSAILDKITELEDNKIYYTTSDNTKLFPKTDANLYGAILISNTYKDGQGILVFDDAVTSIGDAAFSGCTSLTSVTIPDRVTSIGEVVFKGCSNLKEFKGKFASEDGRCLVVDGKLVAFAPFSLTQYSIPDSVTSIGNYAFENCSSLTSVTIGNGITEFGDWAFNNCSSLTSVTIGNGVTSIGECAFVNCSSLTSIAIPDSVTSIGKAAFYGCSSLKEVYCKPTTPPSGNYNMFDSNASGRKIYVPTKSVEAYKTADYWGLYESSIEGYDFE